MSIANRLVGACSALLAVLARSDLSKDAELLVLRHENQALRRHLSGRLRWDHGDRLWLAALARLVSRRWTKVFPATPAGFRNVPSPADQLLRWRPSGLTSTDE